eukprot:CAMPEP_0119143944 /NCGR_PEP_ID=MMETSP1310-20130426/35115_1 /TAXON_ID=464262 /ORGANISM="Genus nov. species nov., Strain RCC2339" /LENGTH=49 /DNA_ID= /DNA_START= /DNA_END= /DNA_ORIENTATION=
MSSTRASPPRPAAAASPSLNAKSLSSSSSLSVPLLSCPTSEFDSSLPSS